MKNAPSPLEIEALVRTLESRFLENMSRHPGIDWTSVIGRLEASPEKLRSLSEMERTGGEPDVVSRDALSGEIVFVDCAPETPKGRVGVCYDREAMASRKEHKPVNNALDLAFAMGIRLLTEEEYHDLQKLGEFDSKTSSWVHTPQGIRSLGGAIFCDRRFGRVFTYHNGAQSYFSVRGFRGLLRV